MSESQYLSRSMRALKIGALWSAFASSPLSFQLVCVYVFWEYVRPQQIYSFLAGPPWSLISLVCAALAFLAEGRKPRLPGVAVFALAAFSTVIVLSSAFAQYPSVSFNDLDIYFGWLLVIALITGTVTTERRWYIFLVLMLLYSLKMSQHGLITWVKRGFAFASWGVNGAPGWFQNSGEFALQMGIFVPLAVYTMIATWKDLTPLKRTLYLFLPFSGLASIVASSSRGGLLAIVAVGLWAVIRSKYKVRALIGFAVALPILWLVVPEESKARFGTAGSDATSVQRLTYWKRGVDMARQHPVLGVGHNNWVPYYQDHYWVEGDSLNRYDSNGQVMIYLAHNSFVQVLSELGYLGLLCFLGVIGSVLHTNYRTRKILEGSGERGRFLALSARALDDGTIAFCIAGFFMSVAYYPFLWFQLAMSVGVYRAAVSMRQAALSAGRSHATVRAAPRPPGAVLPVHPTTQNPALGTRSRRSADGLI